MPRPHGPAPGPGAHPGGFGQHRARVARRTASPSATPEEGDALRPGSGCADLRRPSHSRGSIAGTVPLRRYAADALERDAERERVGIADLMCDGFDGEVGGALADGNKRLAWFVTVAFLELNEVDLIVDDVDATDRFLRMVAAGEVGLDDLATWIRERMHPFAGQFRLHDPFATGV